MTNHEVIDIEKGHDSVGHLDHWLLCRCGKRTRPHRSFTDAINEYVTHVLDALTTP